MELISRAINVLETIIQDPGGLTLTEIAVHTGLPKPTVHRLLSDLIDKGWVYQQQHSKTYCIGYQLGALAQQISYGNTLTQIVQPFLDEAQGELGETLFFTGLLGGRCICLATSEGTGKIRFYMSLGQTMPLHASAAAWAILAFHPEHKRIIAAWEYKKFTTSTITTEEDLLQRLAKVRQEKVAICTGELDEGVTAVSVPVFSKNGHVLGSLTYLGLIQRIARTLPDGAHYLTGLAGKLSASLGEYDTMEGQLCQQ